MRTFLPPNFDFSSFKSTISNSLSSTREKELKAAASLLPKGPVADLLNAAAAVQFKQLEEGLRVCRGNAQAMAALLEAAKGVTALEFLTSAKSIDRNALMGDKGIAHMLKKIPDDTAVSGLINKFGSVSKENMCDAITTISSSATDCKN
uniref:Uncharacterized protein n=1 Tax=Spongospora subterranea TaxID=70186 RepID=A0A0H5QFB1_9EUKA|eukprot:CRZ00728.1 hypothetical protein [Spongospora subterranea]